MLRFIILCFALAMAVGQNHITLVERCHANVGGAFPSLVRIDVCEFHPCSVPANSTASVYMRFVSPIAVETPRTMAISIITTPSLVVAADIDIGPHADTCSTLSNSQCPLSVGQTAELTFNLPLNFAVGTNVEVEVRIVDATNFNIAAACFRINIRMLSPRLGTSGQPPLPRLLALLNKPGHQ